MLRQSLLPSALQWEKNQCILGRSGLVWLINIFIEFVLPIQTVGITYYKVDCDIRDVNTLIMTNYKPTNKKPYTCEDFRFQYDYIPCMIRKEHHMDKVIDYL